MEMDPIIVHESLPSIGTINGGAQESRGTRGAFLRLMPQSQAPTANCSLQLRRVRRNLPRQMIDIVGNPNTFTWLMFVQPVHLIKYSS